MSQLQCRTMERDGRIELQSPAFTYTLDITANLHAIDWTSHLAAQTVTLGAGPEFVVELDRADHRINITGWRGQGSIGQSIPLDSDPGYTAGYQQQYFDDRHWVNVLNCAEITGEDQDSGWARTHVFLPCEHAGKPLTLVLGGWGLFDFRTMRVFVNGSLVGTREVTGRWHTPGTFVFEPGTPLYEHLRWGQDNVIALQLHGYIRRTARLDALDPLHGREFYRIVWPPQFEQYLIVGQRLHSPTWVVQNTHTLKEGDEGIWRVDLIADDADLRAQVEYRWDAVAPVLHRQVKITNTGANAVRILNLQLGTYQTNATVSEGEQGFPVYLDDTAWVGLAHPSGWVTGEDGTLELRQHPGELLAPGGSFQSMNVVMGVAAPGAGRQGFLEHLRSRMRRTLRGHDRAYAIFEGLGSWDYDPDTAPGPYGQIVSQEASDDVLLPNLRALVDSIPDAGYHFDIYSLEMWADYNGDLTRFDPERFPAGLANINALLADIGTAPGLWIDGSMAAWSIGGNPVVKATMTHDVAYPTSRETLCRATDPIKTMYRTAFVHHINQHGVRHIKNDNLTALCYNPTHPHLPGVYSTEAIQSEVIETLRVWDATNPDVLLMLYWGYRSPWWLLHSDTIFEPGLFIEAAHPGSSPTLYLRDSVTQGLDQAQWWAVDIPTLGKDSLGVWLSDWKWNSSIGTERWQEAFVMDMCRGNLLAQPWSDGPWLDLPQRRQMADFIALLRGQPECFGNSRFIIGNPWHNEPYGYCCTNSNRSFIAINNCAWADRTFHLDLNPTWGLRAGGGWDVYRRYPDPAMLTAEPVGESISLALRPFEVVLLEIVATRDDPAPGARGIVQFPQAHAPIAFDEPTCAVPVNVTIDTAAEPLPVPREQDRDAHDLPGKQVMRVSGSLPASTRSGTLAVTAELRRNGNAVVTEDIGKFFAVSATIAGVETDATPVLRNRTYPAPWQAWRIAVEPGRTARPWEVAITIMAPDDANLECRATFIPD